MSYRKEALEYVLREGRIEKGFTLVHEIVTSDIGKNIPFLKNGDGRVEFVLEKILPLLIDRSEKIIIFNYKWDASDYCRTQVGPKLYESMRSRINGVITKSSSFRGVFEMNLQDNLMDDLEWFWLGIPEWVKRRVLFVIPLSEFDALADLFSKMVGPVYEKHEKSAYFKAASQLSSSHIVVCWGVEATHWFFPELLIDRALEAVISSAKPHQLYRE